MNIVIAVMARLLLAQLFIGAGLSKLGAGYAATGSYMQMMGVPKELLPLVIALEIVGGLALAVGFLARWAALALAVFSLLAAAIFHHHVADPNQWILLTSDIAVAGGLLLVYVHGAGAFGFDTLSPDSNPLNSDLLSRMRRSALK